MLYFNNLFLKLNYGKHETPMKNDPIFTTTIFLVTVVTSIQLGDPFPLYFPSPTLYFCSPLYTFLPSLYSLFERKKLLDLKERTWVFPYDSKQSPLRISSRKRRETIMRLVVTVVSSERAETIVVSLTLGKV